MIIFRMRGENWNFKKKTLIRIIRNIKISVYTQYCNASGKEDPLKEEKKISIIPGFMLLYSIIPGY